jgi:hypothetical protein
MKPLNVGWVHPIILSERCATRVLGGPEGTGTTKCAKRFPLSA